MLEIGVLVVHQIITTIKLGFVNSYIISMDKNNVLVDTGYRRKRKNLVSELERAGCKPDNLKLVILTHQDFDHSGNASYVREKYNASIGMHIEDSEAVKRGDMLWNRKGRNIVTRIIMKVLLFLFRTGKFEKFIPDIYLDDGDDLSAYGINATVLHLPGHSKGSIGILTAEGDLICGDLFMNFRNKPDKSSLIDDKRELLESIERLRNFEIYKIYPGHGSPFDLNNYYDAKKE